MATDQGRQYGLILSKKVSNQEIIQRPSVFDEGSDSGDSGKEGGDWKKKAYQREALKSTDKRQIHKALNQDPTIYQYDEVYDDIKANKTVPKKEEKKQSRYIQSLKRHAERRKLENERRLERQVQKERQAEGEEFRDKETFVTSSYKKKLEEFQKLEEEEKRMDRLEEIGDVSKQKDISGFYRHLYKTTVDTVPTVQTEDKKDQGTGNEKEGGMEFKISKSPPKEATKDIVKPEENNPQKQKRQYRKRTKSGSSKEEGEKTSSSSSSSYSSSSSSDSEDDKSKEKRRENKKQSRERSPDKKKILLSHGKGHLESLTKSTITEDGKENKKKKSENTTENDKQKSETTKLDSTNDTKKVVQEPITSVNIWLKRTVGVNFDDALRRYLERKSKRQGSC